MVSFLANLFPVLLQTPAVLLGTHSGSSAFHGVAAGLANKHCQDQGGRCVGREGTSVSRNASACSISALAKPRGVINCFPSARVSTRSSTGGQRNGICDGIMMSPVPLQISLGGRVEVMALLWAAVENKQVL